MRHFQVIAFVFSLVFASLARGQVPMLVGGSDFELIGVDLGGGTELVGSAENTANGLSANTPWGSSGDGISFRFNEVSEFRYGFAAPATIDGSFYLYNGWDIQDQSIRDFTLSFLDAAGAPIGTSFHGVGGTGVDDEVFALPQSYEGVQSAVLTVESTHTPHLEFREVAFDGALVPEPSTSCLLLLSACGVGAYVRRSLKICR